MIPDTLRNNEWFHLVILVAGSLLLLGLLYWMMDILMPFLVAFLLAYILDPAVDWLQDTLRIGRMPAILLLLLVGGILLVLVGSYLTDQAIQLGEEIRRIVNQPPDLGAWFRSVLPPWVLELIETSVGDLQSRRLFENLSRILWRNIAEIMTSFRRGTDLLTAFLSRTVGFIGALVNLVVILFATIYFLRDFDAIIRGIRQQIPPRYRKQTSRFFREIDTLLRAFFRGHLIVCLIIGTLYGLGYVLVGLRGGFLIGFMSGLMNVIPYLGPTLGFGLALLMGLWQFGFSSWLLGVIAVFVVVQSLEGNILTPNIVGRAVGLNPVAVIFALMVFGKLMGFVGLLVAIPIAAIIKVILRQLLGFYRQSQFFQPRAQPDGNPEDPG